MMTEKKQYERRHGSPFDRGSADAYYRRPKSPHYYVKNTYSSKRIEKPDMTLEEIEAYNAGYDQQDDFKDWG